jgi:hypothetical protein
MEVDQTNSQPASPANLFIEFMIDYLNTKTKKVTVNPKTKT